MSPKAGGQLPWKLVHPSLESQHAILVAAGAFGLSLFLPLLWGAVARELLLCGGVVALTSLIGEAGSMLKISYELVEMLLGTMCDGFVLLRQDGSVAFADSAASDILGLEATDSGSQSTLFGDGAHVLQGLRILRMTTKAGKRLELETHTSPCPAFPQGLALSVSRVLRAPAPFRAEGRWYLCTIRIRQEVGSEERGFEQDHKGKQIAGAGGAGQSGTLLELPNPGVSPLSGGHIIKPEFHIDASDEDDKRSFMASSAVAGPTDGKPYTIPGSPWQAIQAMGLGVGNYKKVRIVGRGGQGHVWQVASQDGTQHAQKDISLKGVLWHRDFPKRLRDADREVRALKGLAWASCVIVPITDCWIQADFEMASIVMEWLPRNMNEVLRKMRKEAMTVPLEDACRWLAHIGAGVAAIHSAGFIHRDLKTANILLDEHLQVCKIADLGVSRPLRQKGDDFEDMASQVSMKSERTRLSANSSVLEPQSILSGYTVRPGTNAYSSPEALESTDYGCSSDIFSLGVVLLEILTLEMPPELQMGETKSRVPARAKELLVPKGISCPTSTAIRVLCLKTLQPRPDDRPSAVEVAMERFLQPYVEKLMQQCPKLRTVLMNG